MLFISLRCDRCDAEFSAERKRGRRPKWCPECREADRLAVCMCCGGNFPAGKRGNLPAYCERCSSPPIPTTCTVCHSGIPSPRTGKRVCSDLCRSRQRSGAVATQRSCKECDTHFVSASHIKRYCSVDCQLVASRREYAANRPPSVWDERRRANQYAREARKRGNGYERFTRAEIAARDRWTCGLCREPIDRSLEHPDPRSLSLDHIVPLSLGGPHTRANTQASHLECNVRKGNRSPGEQLALI